MAGLPLFLFLLTAREVGLSAEDLHAVRSTAPCCGHFDRRCAFVCTNHKIGAAFVVKTGASAVVLDRRFHEKAGDVKSKFSFWFWCVPW